MASKEGLLDLEVYDYELVFGTKVNLGLDKAQRLVYGDSEMTHAMVLTAIHVQVGNAQTASNQDLF
jgi:bleomycin hydrolase